MARKTQNPNQNIADCDKDNTTFGHHHFNNFFMAPFSLIPMTATVNRGIWLGTGHIHVTSFLRKSTKLFLPPVFLCASNRHLTITPTCFSRFKHRAT